MSHMMERYTNEIPPRSEKMNRRVAKIFKRNGGLRSKRWKSMQTILNL
jgi:hypothetical protein